MILKKNTSIYKLANFDDQLPYMTDLCTVLKLSLVGLVFYACMAGLFTMAILVISVIPFHIIMYWITGVFILSESLTIILLLIMSGILGTLVYYIFKLINKTRKGIDNSLESWVVTKTIYKGWKDKICFMVKVED